MNRFVKYPMISNKMTFVSRFTNAVNEYVPIKQCAFINLEYYNFNIFNNFFITYFRFRDRG